MPKAAINDCTVTHAHIGKFMRQHYSISILIYNLSINTLLLLHTYIYIWIYVQINMKVFMKVKDEYSWVERIDMNASVHVKRASLCGICIIISKHLCCINHLLNLKSDLKYEDEYYKVSTLRHICLTKNIPTGSIRGNDVRNI